tara:strand:- start:1428 stop:2213 length:786 start_codon:yes stop_codon:yes gene_type:complete
MSFLDLDGKAFLVFGVANKKSVAWHVAKLLESEGARVIYSVRSEKRRIALAKEVGSVPIFVCDVERQEEIDQLYEKVSTQEKRLNGIVHSIAFANYPKRLQPFHETLRVDFLQAVDISCFSLVAISNTFRPILDSRASVVAVSISTTRMAAENYGYMAPIKAALDSSICFLAKSFSAFSEIRFNTVNPGLLKTSASAGIPGYINSYLYAENKTLRKRALATQEVANTVVFLLSERSSGINAQGIVLDAGMSINYFDDVSGK